MARYVNCKKGLHNYSPVGGVGGGIARRTCFVCGNVQLDLKEVPVVIDTDLFTETKLASIFEVEALLAKLGNVPVQTTRTFGVAPSKRRRPARATG